MRVLFDSNVLLSAGLFPNGKAAETVNYAAAKHKIVISNTIVDEVRRVVSAKFAEKMPLFERFFASFTYEYAYISQEIVASSAIEISDPKDKHVLVSATFANVDILITGDKHFFERKYEEIKVMTPSEFFGKVLK